MLYGRLHEFKNLLFQLKCCYDIPQTRTGIWPFKTVSERLKVFKDPWCGMFHWKSHHSEFSRIQALIESAVCCSCWNYCKMFLYSCFSKLCNFRCRRNVTALCINFNIGPTWLYSVMALCYSSTALDSGVVSHEPGAILFMHPLMMLLFVVLWPSRKHNQNMYSFRVR